VGTGLAVAVGVAVGREVAVRVALAVTVGVAEGRGVAEGGGLRVALAAGSSVAVADRAGEGRAVVRSFVATGLILPVGVTSGDAVAPPQAASIKHASTIRSASAARWAWAVASRTRSGLAEL